MRRQMLLLLIANAFASSGNHGRCFSKEEISNLGINPSTRKVAETDKTPLTIRGAVGDWETSYVNYYLHRIILEEAQGYTFAEEDQLAFFSAMNWDFFAEDTADIAFEVWNNADAQKFNLTIINNPAFILGDLGYFAQSGFYMGKDMLEKWDVTDAYTAEWWETYTKEPAVQHLRSINHPEWIKSNEALMAELNGACGDTEGDMWQPIETFEPSSCRGDPESCFAIPSVMAYYDPNFYQSLLENLQLKAVLFFWGPCRQKIIVKHMLKNDVPMIFWWSEPNEIKKILEKEISMIHFPRPTSYCLENWNMTNLNGEYSSVNCDFPPMNLLKVGKTDLWHADVYDDGRSMISRSHVSISTMEAITNVIYERGGAQIPFNRQIMFEATCEWLKENTNTWKPWVSNDYTPPEEGMDLSAMLLAFFAIVALMVVVVFALNYFGVFELVAEQYLTRSFNAVMRLLWKTVDLAGTVVSCLYEVNPEDSIDTSFKFLMIAFMAMHLITFIHEVYYVVPYICWIFDYNSRSRSEILKAKIHHEQVDAEHQANIALAGIISFLFEDIPGVCLQLYALLQYEQLVNFVFVLCVAIQVLEAGSSMNSFEHYSMALQGIKRFNEISQDVDSIGKA